MYMGSALIHVMFSELSPFRKATDPPAWPAKVQSYAPSNNAGKFAPIACVHALMSGLMFEFVNVY